MQAEATVRVRESQRPGVSGEFHTQGGLKLAVRIARRHGFPLERMWLIGDPARDRLGDEIGFVLPAGLVREAAVAGAVIGLLVGLLCAWLLPPKPFGEMLRGLLPWCLSTGIAGWLAATGLASLGMSARIGAYLQSAQTSGLRLKILIPTDVPEPEQARQAELAERALREAKAETLLRLDGTTVVNSPQSAEYVA